jgi:amino acid adenylation domain-containing protein
MDTEGVIHLLAKARRNGISISMKGGKLSVRAEQGQNPDESLLEELKYNRDEIVGFLTGRVSGIVAPPAGPAPPVRNGGRHTGPVRAAPAAPVMPGSMAAGGGKAPLSFAQERIWIIDRLKGTTDYHLPVVLRWDGVVEQTALIHAIRKMIDRHQILRTHIKEELGAVRQYVRDSSEWTMDYRDDISGETAINKYVEEFVRKPFDLSKDFMLRVSLLKTQPSKYLLIIVAHHISSDGLSLPLMVREFVELYEAGCKGRPAKLPELNFQYADYAAWQRSHMEGDRLKEKLFYWQERLKGVRPLEFPLDHRRPLVLSIHGDAVEQWIEKELADQLLKLARAEGVTLFMLLLTAAKTLLYRYSGQQDICVGTPIAERTQRETEGLIGFFTNTLVLRTTLEKGISFRSLLKEVKINTLEAFQHMDTPFEKLVDSMTEKRDMSRNPLFQVMFVLQGAPQMPVLDLPDVHLSVEPAPSTTSKFELTFDVLESVKGLHLRVEYNTDLWKRETIGRLGGHYKELLRSVVADAGRPIEQLNILTPEERRVLCGEGKEAAPGALADATLVKLWEEQAAATPDHIALVAEGTHWSYRQLNGRANRLARYLRDHCGICRNEITALLFADAERMILSMIAVLKSGGAYLPLDPEHPRERIEFLLADSGSKKLLDEKEWALFLQTEQSYEENDLPRVNEAGDLAYVIYTSGTTGRPKGTLIEHRNVARLIKNPLFRTDFSSRDVWTLFHSFCFDFSVWEMYGALLYGGTLVWVPRTVARDPGAFLHLLEEQRVTILNQTPPAFYQLIPVALTRTGTELALRLVIFGGEALDPGRLKEWNQRYPGVRLINMYGITETTVHVTYKELNAMDIEAGRSNIGVALPGVNCYVLDATQGLLPIGVPGELYVGGTGVGRGYLNRADLTARRFIENPFRNGERLYRSGDSVKMFGNGELEYLGRIDHQVKIRGHRIELGEIEHVLRQFPAVSASLVVDRDGANGEKEMVAYFVTTEKLLHATDINNFLKSLLPAYMLPAHYVQLDEFPLTENGKIDRKNLPDPEASALPAGTEYAAPETSEEEKLAAIWREILGKEKIGVTDNFFEVGGNSIKLIRMVGMINKAFEQNLSVVSAFTQTTIRALADHLRSKGKEKATEGADTLKSSAELRKGTINFLQNKRI